MRRLDGLDAALQGGTGPTSGVSSMPSAGPETRHTSCYRLESSSTVHARDRVGLWSAAARRRFVGGAWAPPGFDRSSAGEGRRRAAARESGAEAPHSKEGRGPTSGVSSMPSAGPETRHTSCYRLESSSTVHARDKVGLWSAPARRRFVGGAWAPPGFDRSSAGEGRRRAAARESGAEAPHSKEGRGPNIRGIVNAFRRAGNQAYLLLPTGVLLDGTRAGQSRTLECGGSTPLCGRRLGAAGVRPLECR